MAYSPYQIAGTKASLTDLLQESRFRGEQSKSKTAVQMGKLEEEFEADLEAAQAKARRDSKKNKGLFQGLNLLGTLFLGPLGAGLTKGITAGIQGDQQRQALKGLLSDVYLPKAHIRRISDDLTRQLITIDLENGLGGCTSNCLAI